jgi:multidrug efflux pump subunit AcrA (membrane-fusion protein)
VYFCIPILRFIPILVLVILIIGLLYAPIKIPFNLVSLGRVVPSREWVVTQDPSGTITGRLTDYLSTISQQTHLFQFERGDLVAARLSLKSDSVTVSVGDTVIRVRPLLIANRMAELESQRAVAEAVLQSALAGEKKPIVAEAQARIATADATIALARQELQMQETLMRDSLTSQQLLRMAKTELEVALTEREAAVQFLKNVDTGVKPEDIVLAKKQQELILRQIALLEKQNDLYFLTSPFSGRPAVSEDPAALLRLIDESKYLLHIPIKVEDLYYMPKNPIIEVTDIVTRQVYLATLYKIPQEVHLVGGRRVVMIQALIEKPKQNVSIGMSLNCIIKCGDINQRTYISRLLRSPQ